MLFFGSNLERGLATIDRTSLPLRTSKYKYYTAKFFFKINFECPGQLTRTSTNHTDSEVNDYVSLQWPSYEQPQDSNLKPQGSKPLSPKLLPLDHFLDSYYTANRATKPVCFSSFTRVFKANTIVKCCINDGYW
jgi:hypothetical protein